MILRAWIDAILYHAQTQITRDKRHSFVMQQFNILQADFKVRLVFNEKDWTAEIRNLDGKSDIRVMN